MGGLSVWHTPSPLKSGGPLPRIPPLYDTLTGVKKGVNPLNLVKSFLNKKSPFMFKKLFGKKSLKVGIPPICQNKFLGKILIIWTFFIILKKWKKYVQNVGF